MQYFRHQLEARQLSRRLVVLFVVAVLCVTASVSAVMLTLAATLSNGLIFFRVPDGPWLQQHPAAVISTVLLVLGVMASAVLLKRMELREGGAAVARALGGERITADSRDPLQRRLHNVVEEMAIAAGIALPEVYVLPREPGINAFAAGLTPANAAIAVTHGALELLNRDELQGVVAHEFSHIVNNDIRLNLHLIAWLHGLMALAVIARGMLRFAPTDARGRRSGLPPVWVAAFAVMVLGYVGLLFGRLIQAAVARRREALADASAVQFTRNPEGLRGALLKIAASTTGAQLREVNTDEVAHMLFFPSNKQWFATHPPIEARIGALGVGFDADELQRVRRQLQQRATVNLESDSESQRIEAGQAAPQSESFLSNVTLSAAALSASVGNAQVQHLHVAEQVRLSLPTEVVQAAAQADDAVALLLAQAIAVDAHPHADQLDYIRNALGPAIAQRCAALLPVVAQLKAAQRQPVLQILLPQLRQLPSGTRMRISSCLNGLAQSGQVSVAQYALRKLARMQLHDAFPEPQRRQPQMNLAQAIEPLAALLAVLAQQGHAQMQPAHQAYERAMQHLCLRQYPRYTQQSNWPGLLDTALLRLDRVQPMGKQLLIEAMWIAVTHDSQITMQEAELVRVFCACLHCPVPPLLRLYDVA